MYISTQRFTKHYFAATDMLLSVFSVIVQVDANDRHFHISIL